MRIAKSLIWSTKYILCLALISMAVSWPNAQAKAAQADDCYLYASLKSSALQEFTASSSGLNPTNGYPLNPAATALGESGGRLLMLSTDGHLRLLDPRVTKRTGTREYLSSLTSARQLSVCANGTRAAVLTKSMLKIIDISGEKVANEFDAENADTTVGIAISASGTRAYASLGNSIGAFDARSREPKKYAPGAKPLCLALSQTGDTLFAGYKGHIRALATKDGSEKYRIELGAAPERLFVMKDRLYVAGKGGQLSCYDTVRRTQAATVATGASITAIQSIYGRLFVGTADGRVLTLDGASLNKLSAVELGSPVLSLAVREHTYAQMVRLSEETLRLSVGGSAQLSATVGPSTATDKSVTFESNDTSVAKVDEKSGAIVAIAPGTADISAFAVGSRADAAAIAKCRVVVLREQVEAAAPMLEALDIADAARGLSAEEQALLELMEEIIESVR